MKVNFTYKVEKELINKVKIMAIKKDINANELIDIAIKEYIEKEDKENKND